jgi:hypothetical protein
MSPSIPTGSGTRVIANRFDPPIEVNQQPGQLGHARFVGSKTANSGGIAYAIQRAARCGLELQTSAQLKRLIAVLIEGF